MEPIIEAQSLRSELTDNHERRAHPRFRPSKMIAVLSSSSVDSTVACPSPVLDFSVGGLALLTQDNSDEFKEGFVSIFNHQLALHGIPCTVVGRFRVGPLTRLNIKLATESEQYVQQQAKLGTFELHCMIEEL